MASASPFFGVKLSGNCIKKLKELEVHEDECLHLSGACLQQPESGNTEYALGVIKAGETDPVVICILNGQCRQVHLDLVLDYTDSITLKVNGKDTKNVVHLTGFFDVETGDEASDDAMSEAPLNDPQQSAASVAETAASEHSSSEEGGQHAESQSDGDGSDSGEEEESAGHEETAEIEVEAAAMLSSSSEDDDEDDEEDVKGKGQADEDEDDDSDSELEAVPEPVPEPKKSQPKKEAKPVARKDHKKEAPKKDDKKRKADAHPEASPSKKPNNEVDNYVGQVIKFLKTRGGVAKLGIIGSQCKKPSSLKGLGKFFADRKEFRVQGDEIHLA